MQGLLSASLPLYVLSLLSLLGRLLPASLHAHVALVALATFAGQLGLLRLVGVLLFLASAAGGGTSCAVVLVYAFVLIRSFLDVFVEDCACFDADCYANLLEGKAERTLLHQEALSARARLVLHLLALAILLLN